MAGWKRDVASGLVILVPILVTAYVIGWLYGAIAGLSPVDPVKTAWLIESGVPEEYATQVAEFIRVVLSLVVFSVVVLAVGYLMRTAVGTLFERTIDDLANQVPGLRVVYNASKMAVETALGGTEELQTPVKLETWDGIRMTAFKTGKVTADGRDVLFLPTAPNITTGYVIEVESEQYEETNERVEDALTRILSAGFGDADNGKGIPIDVTELTDDDD